MGGVLAVLFYPWLVRLEKKKISTGLASALLTLVITVILILPTSLLIFFTAKMGFSQLEYWKKSGDSDANLVDSFLRSPKVQRILEWISGWVPVDPHDMANSFRDLMAGIWSRLAELLGGVLTHLPGIAMTVLIVVVSVYFFLVDGRKLVAFLRKNTIFSQQQTDRIIKIVAEMCRSVILASCASGAAQMVLEVLGCVVTGTPNVALIGLFVFVGSFIPVVGSAPITIIVALQQLVEGRQVAGIVLLVMAVVIIGADNAVRPMFLKGSANLHPLVAFVAAFGGLQTIGFSGVFLGPIIASLFVITFKILVQKE